MISRILNSRHVDCFKSYLRYRAVSVPSWVCHLSYRMTQSFPAHGLVQKWDFASKGRDPNIFETRREPLELGKQSQHFQVQKPSSNPVSGSDKTSPSEFKVLRLLPACREHLAAAARAAQASATYFGTGCWKETVPRFRPKPPVCFHKTLFWFSCVSDLNLRWCFRSLPWRGRSEWGGPRRQVLVVKCQFFFGAIISWISKVTRSRCRLVDDPGGFEKCVRGLRDTNIFKIKLDAFSDIYIYTHTYTYAYSIYIYIWYM